MTRYIAFLRAVNVGGHAVRMQRLRELFGELGLAGVRTYIQTGNVFFDTDEPDRAALTERIERHLAQALGYQVATFLRTADEVEATLALNPFAGREITPDMRLAVVFTARPFPADVPLPMLSPKGDVEIVHATPGEVFLIWYIRDGRPPNPGPLLDRLLAGQSTSRFYGTTAKILAAARR
jgi:uncharacterized protein (DUF1697 family)